MDQRCFFRGISLPLNPQSSCSTISPGAGDDPGLSNTVVDDGVVRKSDEKQSKFVTEPGNRRELKLSPSRPAEMKSTGGSLGGGGEEEQEVVITLNQGLRFQLLLFNVVTT